MKIPLFKKPLISSHINPAEIMQCWQFENKSTIELYNLSKKDCMKLNMYSFYVKPVMSFFEFISARTRLQEHQQIFFIPLDQDYSLKSHKAGVKGNDDAESNFIMMHISWCHIMYVHMYTFPVKGERIKKYKINILLAVQCRIKCP